MSPGNRLDHICVVLNEPRYPENIGAAARAMRNMGIRDLRVVAPRNYDLERVRKMATHAASDVVDALRLFDTLSEALAEVEYVVGTTARLGGQRRVFSPTVMAEKLTAISPENRVALVFGREDRGLSNEDLRVCHELVNIPTAEFSSLNLAQAVMIMCYECFRASGPERKAFVPRLASRHELDGMYAQLKDILVGISYLQPDNPDYWMNHIRSYFTRLQLRASEVSIIRGLIRQVTWFAEKRYRDGLQEGVNTRSSSEEKSCG